VKERLEDTTRKPLDLVVLDGGKPQMNAVLKAIAETQGPRCGMIAAVKPAGRHSSISRFLLSNGSEVSFDPADPSHNMLQLLRDDAHDLSNKVHRDLRDMGHHYELAAILPGLNETERRKLVTRLGSVKNLLSVDEQELEQLAGKEKAAQLIASINAHTSREPGAILPLVVPIRFDAEGGNAEDLRPIATR
jgi:excinuclease ABC subunit C